MGHYRIWSDLANKQAPHFYFDDKFLAFIFALIITSGLTLSGSPLVNSSQPGDLLVLELWIRNFNSRCLIARGAGT
jgi:hypothetical protein